MKNSRVISLYFIVIVLCLGCKEAANKQGDTKESIHQLMNYYYINNIFNGAVLVAKGGEIIYENTFGYTDYKRTEKLTRNSVFSLASVSKTFTSTAIMLLIEHDELRFEDKLSKFFPDFPNAEKITIWNLLTHTAGLINYLEYGGYFRVKGHPGDFQDSVTREKTYNYLKSIDSLRFDPGSKREYSNSGYFMLSMIVEKVSGKPFYQFIQDEILNPLQMNNSYIKSEPNLKVKNRAFGFTDFNQPDDDNLLTSGDGGVLSTVEDLYKWHTGLSSDKIISKKTLKQTYINPHLKDGTLSQDSSGEWIYGMGWLFRMNDTDSIAWHDGGLNACFSLFYQDFGNDFTIIILSNKGGTNSNHPIYTIRDAIIHILKNEEYSFPKIPISQKMFNLLENNPIIEASSKCNALWSNNKNDYDFNINHLNRLGYYYLQQKEYDKAKIVFKLNCEFHPENANVYDSYGESLMLNGEYELAIKYYKKSLELNPQNTNAQRMIEKIHKELY